jgi:DNA-binding MarR family transcriptional regulator
MTVSGIGGAIHLDSSTITPLLKRLEVGGLVVRNRDMQDERKVHVSLTDAGQEMEARTAHISACIFEKTGLTTAALERLHTEVSELGERLRASSELESRPGKRRIASQKATT